MEKREDALREALLKNAEATLKWEHYKMENDKVINSLDMYVKQHVVDIEVPVGRRAFMRGQLIHTNEVLVGHFQGYFSECSAHKAKEICQHRIKMAEERLQLLHTEAELWQNKLDMPYEEGVFPNAEQREIIEEYDEEKEELWREQHRLRIKEAKLREKEQRENEVLAPMPKPKDVESSEDGDEAALALLEDAELMEELAHELELLDVVELNDDTLRQLMSGELKLPEKKRRVGHDPQAEEVTKPEQKHLQSIVKKTELNMVKPDTPPTNNKLRPNPEIEVPVASIGPKLIVGDNLSEIDLSEEVQLIRNQANFLPPADQIVFYDYHIEIVRQKLRSMPIRTEEDINAKIRLMAMLDKLEEFLEISEETVGAEELKAIEEDGGDDENEAELKVNIKNVALNWFKPQSTQKRRISFALEDQTIEFRRNETVAEMLPKPEPSSDVIQLDEPEPPPKSPSPPPEIISSVDKKSAILERVEQQQQYISEHQSAQDINLVDQILQTEECHTLRISFQHSIRPGLEQETAPIASEPGEAVIPGTPADLYQDFLRARDSNAAESATATATQTPLVASNDGGGDQVKVPLMREVDRQLAYEDPRLKFSTPVALNGVSKSILRNKDAVDNEKHIRTNNNINYNHNKKPNNNKKNKKQKSPPPVDDTLSAYYKVLDEVTEKERQNANTDEPLLPDPLPTIKYIDAHAPKKRISRFKQMRTESS